jgi:hypothetical protein
MRSTSQHKSLVHPSATVAIDAQQAEPGMVLTASAVTLNSLVNGGPSLQRESGASYGTYELPTHRKYFALQPVTAANCIYRLSSHHSYASLTASTIVFVGRAPTLGAATKHLFTIYNGLSTTRINCQVNTSRSITVFARRLDADAGATSATAINALASAQDFVLVLQCDYSSNNLKMWLNGSSVYNSTFVNTSGTLDATASAKLTNVVGISGASWDAGYLHHFQVINGLASDALSAQLWSQFRFMVNL